MPVEADGVPNAARVHLHGAVGGADPQQRGEHLAGWVAHVAWRSGAHIEPSIRPESDVAPPVVPLTWQTIGDDDRPGGMGETRFDRVVAKNARCLCDVERAIPEGHAV